MDVRDVAILACSNLPINVFSMRDIVEKLELWVHSCNCDPAEYFVRYAAEADVGSLSDRIDALWEYQQQLDMWLWEEQERMRREIDKYVSL